MTADADAPRPILAGAFALALLLLGFSPSWAQDKDRAAQQKPKVGAQKAPAQAKSPAGKVKAKPAAKPKQKAKPKAKPKPKPKPLPETRLAPPAEPAWGSMPAAAPIALPKQAKQALTPTEAVLRHRQGLEAEEAGDDHAAFRAFMDAAEAGHGPSQLKLGQIYDRGTGAVERDYGAALGWYQKAREQGIPIPQPHTFPSGR